MSDNHVLIKGDPLYYEGLAAAVITPGELLEYDGSGELILHSAAGGDAEKMVAREEDYVGEGIDVDYAVGDTVNYVIPRRGDILYMFLADGENVAKGDPLESDGAGALQAHTAQAVDEGGAATYTVEADPIVGYADEALNNASGSPSRIAVRIA